MQQLHLEYPHYGWNKNAGYPTKLHRAGIEKMGATEHHRMTFRLLSSKTSSNDE
jgi:ribonuclease HII